MKTLHIGVDIDDVLYPFYDQAHIASEKAGITNGITPSKWSPFADYGCTDQQWYDALTAATHDASLYMADPIPGAIDALYELALMDRVLIHLVTARGALAHGDLIRKHTVDWLTAHEVPFDSLTFSTDKTIVRADYFVEDHPKNAAALDTAGVPVFLVDRPYNQDYLAWKRVESIAEVPVWIETHA